MLDRGHIGQQTRCHQLRHRAYHHAGQRPAQRVQHTGSLENVGVVAQRELTRPEVQAAASRVDTVVERHDQLVPEGIHEQEGHQNQDGHIQHVKDCASLCPLDIVGRFHSTFSLPYMTA